MRQRPGGMRGAKWARSKSAVDRHAESKPACSMRDHVVHIDSGQSLQTQHLRMKLYTCGIWFCTHLHAYVCVHVCEYVFVCVYV